MKPIKSSRGTVAAPLLHLLMVVAGVAVFALMRSGSDEPRRLLSLTVGAVGGTVIGQLFAYGRVKPWLAAFGALVAMWFLCIPGSLTLDLDVMLLSFAPGALCGYASMRERGALVAFWFPAMLWMQSILDGSDGSSSHTVAGWMLLVGLVTLLLAFLRAKETRRVELWTTKAATPLAQPGDRVVLRVDPLRFGAQLAWCGLVGAATIGVTTWVAPLLWQKEVLGTPANAYAIARAPNDLPWKNDNRCCPSAPAMEAPRARVREYLSMLRPASVEEAPGDTGECVLCSDKGVAYTGGAWRSANTSFGVGGDTSASGSTGVEPTTGSPPAAPTSVSPASSSNGGQALATPVEKPKPVPAPPQYVDPPVVAAAPVAARTPMVLSFELAREEGDGFPWLLVLGLTAGGIHLLVRPFRRWLTLRHLRRPLWRETVDQRVSNLWQLVLVGLRDAGHRAAPGEQPLELARRLAIDGIESCATVLERARHGVRVDAADLAEMESSAWQAFRAARARIGVVARAAAWLRSPLG